MIRPNEEFRKTRDHTRMSSVWNLLVLVSLSTQGVLYGVNTIHRSLSLRERSILSVGCVGTFVKNKQHYLQIFE